MEIFSRTYNQRARETGEKEIVFILMRVILNVKAFINDGQYHRHLSATMFDQMRVQFPVVIHNENQNGKISEHDMNSKLRYSSMYRNDRVGPLYACVLVVTETHFYTISAQNESTKE